MVNNLLKSRFKLCLFNINRFKSRHFREAAADVAMQQPGAERRVIMARSEMYTTRRQAADIRAQTLSVLATL